MTHKTVARNVRSFHRQRDTVERDQNQHAVVEPLVIHQLLTVHPQPNQQQASLEARAITAEFSWEN